MLTKEKLINAISTLNEPFTFDDVLEKIYFLERVEKAIKQSENGQVISNQEMEKEIETWFA